ncbi:polyprenyl synthetase family protein [Salinisphaera sp. Q1T1-3]|uniref:polyprenyl synthetase family protein n=1 Tax=Salinisphaera sp. Q1T1-3 TaxID=2321229 RepID=UPI000E73DB6B|nr:farnesyl diphosphate synthase [Salinisphaera sp. Q1T1-3]RJS93971.1 geranyl transferase [Salinisphaera sp. Q1T1-3]
MEPYQATHYSQRIEHVLEACLPTEDRAPARLHEAMRYAALSPGKRMRPRLVYAAATALGVPLSRVDGAAAAIELIHAYSLVHDDLPAMDDDDLRRGRPTTHKAFDDATAILAGDALQALAFEIVATHAGLDDAPAARVAVIRRLGRAVGSRGMVGGQALDIAFEGQTGVTVEDLETVHNLKTGALLSAAVMMAAAAADDLSSDVAECLEIFAARIGLAFQVRDDVLDIESTTEQLGKQQGADIAHDKATYPALLGLDEAKALADRLYTEATAALDILGDRADDLRALAAEIVKRDR